MKKIQVGSFISQPHLPSFGMKTEWETIPDLIFVVIFYDLVYMKQKVEKIGIQKVNI